MRLHKKRNDPRVIQQFLNNPLLQVRLEINQWVANRTNDKIRDLLARGVIDQSTQMVLVNAIYFKGDWLRPFTLENSGNTYDGRFLPFAGAEYQTGSPVKMMSMKNTFRYSGQDPDFQVLGLPYKGNELSMYVFLPKTSTNRPGRTLQDLEPALSSQKLERMISQTREQEVDVTMPKFKMTQNLPLKEVLQRLGMIETFSSAADLSGITGGRDLMISKAIHKAFIEVSTELCCPHSDQINTLVHK